MFAKAEPSKVNTHLWTLLRRSSALQRRPIVWQGVVPFPQRREVPQFSLEGEAKLDLMPGLSAKRPDWKH